MKQLLKNTFWGVSILILGSIFIDATESTNGYMNDAYTVFKIKPSATDPTITRHDDVHLAIYNPVNKKGKLMVFLQGTHGKPDMGPQDFFNTVVEQGYKLIVLSYIDDTGISQVCIGDTLKADCDCPSKFREKRIYGNNATLLIKDQKQDAIINRLVKLLQYLAIHDSGGHWDTYLDNASPKWTMIALSGQSQGGGMAAFIAKRTLVARVITFSGGWDWSVEDKKIANWYSTPSVTPPNLWYGLYNKQEPAAQSLAETYKAMNIPEEHIHGLDLPVRPGRPAHVEGVGNPAYKSLWVEVLGKGN